MGFVGKLKDINKDFLTNKFNITFSVDASNSTIQNLNDIKDEKLQIDVGKYRQKRSLTANAYLWVLLGKMAEKLNEQLETDKYDKDETYIMMLRKYGQYTAVGMVEKAAEKFQKGWKLSEEIDRTVDESGKTLVTMLCYIGSSNYNSKEMSILIDGVVSECKELGIDTMSDAELDRLKEMWGK